MKITKIKSGYGGLKHTIVTKLGMLNKDKTHEAQIKLGAGVVGIFLFVSLLLWSPRGNDLDRSLRSIKKPFQDLRKRASVDDQLMNAEVVWDSLVKEGSSQQQSQGTHYLAMEVGMHVAKQCMQAAQAGLEAHCVEPSPNSFRRVEERVKQEPNDIQSRIHLYHAAAGADNTPVQFTGKGGTGDHVGEFDMWNMKAGAPDDPELAKKQGSTQEVASIRLDDIITKQQKDVFMLKVDTQGFEPAVLSGLTESLKHHRVKFLLMEFWPHGMDLMAGKMNKECIAAELLQSLQQNNYHIYVLGPTAHMRAPKAAKSAFNEEYPAHVRDFCQWFYQLEERFPDKEYKMGYWTDVVAVAPNTQLKDPQTYLGRVVSEALVTI